MKKRKKHLYDFDEFSNLEIPQKTEISSISDDPDPGSEEVVPEADEEKAVILKKDSNRFKDYYDAKQDFIAPKPFRKKSKK